MSFNPKQATKLVLILAVYGVAIWASARLIRFGGDRNQQEKRLEGSRGAVLKGKIEKISAWGLGYVGDVCFTIAGTDGTSYCIQKQYLSPGAGSLRALYQTLRPGADVFLKAEEGQVTEFLIGERTPQAPRIVSWGSAEPLALAHLKKRGYGDPFIDFGILIVPLLALGHFLFRRALLKESGDR